MYINTEQNDADLQLILLILLKHKIQKSFRRETWCIYCPHGLAWKQNTISEELRGVNLAAAVLKSLIG